MKKIVLCLLLVMLVIPVITHSAMIFLNDGSSIKGAIIGADGKSIKVKTAFGEFAVSNDKIKEIKYSAAPVPTPKADTAPAAGIAQEQVAASAAPETAAVTPSPMISATSATTPAVKRKEKTNPPPHQKTFTEKHFDVVTNEKVIVILPFVDETGAGKLQYYLAQHLKELDNMIIKIPREKATYNRFTQQKVVTYKAKKVEFKNNLIMKRISKRIIAGIEKTGKVPKMNYKLLLGPKTKYVVVGKLFSYYTRYYAGHNKRIGLYLAMIALENNAVIAEDFSSVYYSKNYNKMAKSVAKKVKKFIKKSQGKISYLSLKEKGKIKKINDLGSLPPPKIKIYWPLFSFGNLYRPIGIINSISEFGALGAGIYNANALTSGRGISDNSSSYDGYSLKPLLRADAHYRLTRNDYLDIGGEYGYNILKLGYLKFIDEKRSKAISVTGYYAKPNLDVYYPETIFIYSLYKDYNFLNKFEFNISIGYKNNMPVYFSDVSTLSFSSTGKTYSNVDMVKFGNEYYGEVGISKKLTHWLALGLNLSVARIGSTQVGASVLNDGRTYLLIQPKIILWRTIEFQYALNVIKPSESVYGIYFQPITWGFGL